MVGWGYVKAPFFVFGFSFFGFSVISTDTKVFAKPLVRLSRRQSFDFFHYSEGSSFGPVLSEVINVISSYINF